MIHNLAVLLFASVLAAVAQVVSGEENVLERDSIETARQKFDELLADLQGAVTTAESALENVRSMEIEDGRAVTDESFDDLKDKVNGVLDGLAPNSVLMDNLEGAKAKMIVFKRWFERQPLGYQNRDQLIMRVDEIIKSYGKLGDLILAGRQETQAAYRDLLRKQHYQSMESKVRSAELSVEAMRNLVTSLQNVSTQIRQMAEQEVPNPISN